MEKLKKSFILLVFIVGIILRIIYVTNTSIYQYQYDVASKDGHLDYIKCIYQTNHLPKTNDGQYYHQPLHYLICAGWLKVFGMCLTGKALYESLQILTLIYSILLLYFQYKIVQKFKVGFVCKMIVALVASLWPRWIIFSGSINNDLLSYLLMTITLYYLIEWYREDSYKNIILLALFTGLSIMTKMSAIVLSAPVLYVFVIKLISYIKQKNDKKLMVQYLIFGLIALSLGLWYPIRNVILFRQPLLYVLNPDMPELLLTKNYLKNYLLLNFNELFFGHNIVWENSNVLAFIIKGSLWGQFNYFHGIELVFLKPVLIVNIGLSIYALYAFLCEMLCSIKKGREEFVEKNIFSIFLVFNIVLFILNGMRLPYIVTFDIRYIALCLWILSMFIGLRLEKIENEVLRKISVIFVTCCLVIVIVISDSVIMMI